MADVADNTPLDAASALSLGKRHLLVRDYINAVNTLVQGCELLAKEYGEGADELAEPYLLYGRALLGLAREESNVLGSAVPGAKDSDEEDVDDDDEEEGDEEDKDEKDDKSEQEAKKKNSTNTVDKDEKSDADNKEEKPEEKSLKEPEIAPSKEENKTEEQKAEKAEKKGDEASDESTSMQKDVTPTESKEENEKETETEKTNATDEKKTEDKKKNQVTEDEATPGSSKMTNGESSTALNGSTAENGEDDDEDVDNLEVAWEVLELGKLLLLKRGPPGWKLLAEAHKLLGEVAMEGGNANRATTDFQACLDLLQKIEPCDPRAIAEIYYQLGLSFSFMNDYDASIEKFQEASSILETRIKELEQTTEPTKCDDPFYSIEGEIKELKELLPEIGEKISDMKDAKQEACKRLIEGIRDRTAAGSCSNGASTSTSASVSTSTSTSAPTNGEASSSSSSGLSKKSVNDISHLIRKKRKPEEALIEESSPCKKLSPQ